MVGKSKSSGFTIVELLIVIVVIAILATVVIVAYTGAQQRARDAVRTADISNVQKALEYYYDVNNTYPSVGTDNTGYNLSTLSTVLIPQYLQTIPNDPNPSLTNYQYVRGTGGNAYGIRISYETQTPCHRGMNNKGVAWWSLQACP